VKQVLSRAVEPAPAARRPRIRGSEDAASPAEATLLRLQRSAGNAAVCARIADMKSTAGTAEDEGGPAVDVDARTSPLNRNGDGATVAEPANAEPDTGDATATTGGVTVTVPPHIRAPSSPAGMADRIPPRVNTPVHVDVAGLPAGDSLELSIEGGGGGNGTATIDGAATKALTGSVDVNLQGVVQTDAGKGGNLKLVAMHRSQSQGVGAWFRKMLSMSPTFEAPQSVAASAGFSVSSIPQNYSDTFVSLLTGEKRGFVVQDGWESDSGTFGDLDQTEISEQVEVTSQTGCFESSGKQNSGYLAGNKLSKDTHSSPVSIMTKAGHRVAEQTCMFKDKRAGSTDIPMTNSGYTLVRDVRAKDAGGFEFQLTKNGAATTANGIASQAGVGSIDKTQDV